jgi:opacity protein-like surface antigen
VFEHSSRPRVLRFLATALSVGLVLLVPRPASADGIIGAFIGTNFSGDTITKTTVYGGVLGGVQSRGVGFEIDFGYTPDFFDTEEDLGIKTSLTTVMGNLVVGGAAARGVAPFVSGGVGLIRANVTDVEGLVEDLSRNDFGMNVGGGVNAMFSSNAGVRGDIRYFRSFKEEDTDDNFPDFGVDLSDFNFWRASVGVVLRW